MLIAEAVITFFSVATAKVVHKYEMNVKFSPPQLKFYFFLSAMRAMG